MHGSPDKKAMPSIAESIARSSDGEFSGSDPVRDIHPLPPPSLQPKSDALHRGEHRSIFRRRGAQDRAWQDTHSSPSFQHKKRRPPSRRTSLDLQTAGFSGSDPAGPPFPPLTRLGVRPSNRRRPTSRRWRPRYIHRRMQRGSGYRPCGAGFRSRRGRSGSWRPSYYRCGRC